MDQKEFYKEKNKTVTISTRKIKIMGLMTPILDKKQDVLDVGCGDGFLSLLMSFYCKSLTGCDLAPVKAGNYETVEIDLCKKGLKGKYDIVTCFDVLEHLADFDAGLKNIKAALKKTGVLIVNHPDGSDSTQPIDNEIPIMELIKKIDMRLVKLEYYNFSGGEAYTFMAFV
jgi:2-polyprenyl-3-methyl-5-hydroxy-6-metoxy-1,4-benzoquinol methylase